MKVLIDILFPFLIAVSILVLVFHWVIPGDPVKMDSKFYQCPQAVEVPLIGIQTFWYCPAIKKTWKPYQGRWDRPARYEQERIDKFDEQIKKLTKGKPL